MGKHSKQINVYMLLAAMLGLGLSRDSAGKYMSRGKGIRDNLGGGGGGRNIIWDYGYTFPLSCKEFHIYLHVAISLQISTLVPLVKCR